MTRSLIAGLCCCWGLTGVSFAQYVSTPQAAGITPLSGDIRICGSEADCDPKDGAAHRFGAAFPSWNSKNRNFYVVYPNPPINDPVDIIGTNVGFIDIFNERGVRLENWRAAWKDDAGNDIRTQNEGTGASTNGVNMACARDGSGRYCVNDTIAPWRYTGGALAAWGDGALTYPGADAVGVNQVFEADGTPVSTGIIRHWTDDEISDNGQIRSRMVAPLSNGNWVCTFWDLKASLGGLPSGEKWGIVDGRDYTLSGQVVGFVLFKSDGTTLAKKPISTPSATGVSADSMRGCAAGNGWFAIRYEDIAAVGDAAKNGGSKVVYHIFDNSGTQITKINVAEKLVDSGFLIDGVNPITPAQAASIAGGRGDAEYIHGRGDFLYSCNAPGGNAHIYLHKWNARTGALVKIIQVDDGPADTSGTARGQCNPQTDSAGNVFLAWTDDYPTPGNEEESNARGRFFDKNLNPVGPSFLVFENATTAPMNGQMWKDNNSAMGEGVVCVTSHGTGYPGNTYMRPPLQSRQEHVVRFLRSPFAGGRKQGDCNSDGGVDLSDAVCELGFLFQNTPDLLPCGDGSSTDPANLELMDLNGDNGIDLSDSIYLLSYLFQGTDAPVRGTDCLPIVGCSEACNPFPNP